MNKAVLLLGSNIGEQEMAMAKAIQYIEQNAGKVIQQSSIYETAPWGNVNQHYFLNQSVVIETILNAFDLLQTLLTIEEKMGRVRTAKWEPRSIDIDILFFNDEIIHSHELVVPHPLLQERKFTLVPLNEIIPGYVHPLLKQSVAALLNICTDSQEVKLYIKQR